MRFNILCLVVTALVALGAVACSVGTSPSPEGEPPCTDHIEDENYLGSYRAVLGFGEGAYTALQLALDKPGRFNVVAAMNGPTSAQARLADLAARLRDFDDWADDLDRLARLQADADLIAAHGNPFYVNPDSAFYPPGVTAEDFAAGQPVSLPPMYSPEDPDASFPTVTVFEETGEAVEFVLAHDLNGNRRRDVGEPLVLHLHEPFDDANDNGRLDDGEDYRDIGIDGVADTNDYGEGDGRFTVNPRLGAWFTNDPLSLAATAYIDVDAGYQGGFYLESLNDDPWGFNAQVESFADALDARLAAVETETGPFCIRNTLGIYDGFQGDYPVFTQRLWFPEKSGLFRFPTANVDVWDEMGAAERAGRFNHAFRFLSLRMPNGLDDSPKEAPVIWQVREFYSESLQANVRFGVGFPAGYFDGFSSWKTFPVVYVFHDRNSDLNDMREILTYQGDLARRRLAKQALLIVVDGTREAEGLTGFHHYVNQAAGEFGGAYGDALEELIDYVEANFRIQTEGHDRDDD